MIENQLDNEGMPREIWVRPKKFPMNESDIPTGDWFIDYNLPRGHGPIWKYRIAGPNIPTHPKDLDELVNKIASDPFFDGELKGAIRRTIEIMYENGII